MDGVLVFFWWGWVIIMLLGWLVYPHTEPVLCHANIILVVLLRSVLLGLTAWLDTGRRR